ncbi:hypothetical protein [Ferrovum myxofaciens]|uniref:hypothetical protein n=1 Tax=Ferrovum myxofaciens TaxID=416213 RepID=UPI0012373366|nr:hypothetical protein [Ferrovum myxofaciens]
MAIQVSSRPGFASALAGIRPLFTKKQPPINAIPIVNVTPNKIPFNITSPLNGKLGLGKKQFSFPENFDNLNAGDIAALHV